jgi:hypothetical protein
MGDDALEGRRSRPVLETLVVVAVSVAIAILWTWPLVVHLDDGGRSALDSPFEAWTVDWVQHALRHPSTLYDANIFAPTSGALAFSAPLLGVAVPLLPLRWFGLSPIAVYNAGLIASTAASLAGAYLFGRLVLRSRSAAALAAVAFAVGPYPYALATHLQTTARAGIPLAAAAAWWLADRAEQDRPIVLPSLALVATLAWQTSVSLYPAAYALAAVVIVFAVRWRVFRHRPLVFAAAGSAVVAVLVVAIPHLLVWRAYPEADRTVLGPYGANFVKTAARLSYSSALEWRGSPWLLDTATFPGIALIVLALAGAIAGFRDRPLRKVWTLGIAVTGIGIVLALGTGANGWRRFMPYRLVWDYLPGAGALRDFSRAWMLGLLGMGVLGGLAIIVIARRAPRVAAIVAALGCLAIGLEGFAPWTDVTSIDTRPVDTALARADERGSVLYLPIASPLRDINDLSYFRQPEFVYRSTAHHRPTVNGYSGFFPPWSGTSVDLARRLPCRAAREGLWNAGVRFIVVPAQPSAPWEALREPETAAPLELIGRYGSELLYALPQPSDTNRGC